MITFGETGLSLDKELVNEGIFGNETKQMNANFIKTVYGESLNDSYIPESTSEVENNESKIKSQHPFGLMIASEGPGERNPMDFWKMILQENVGKFVSLFNEN